jgi:hypothetical protein
MTFKHLFNVLAYLSSSKTAIACFAHHEWKLDQALARLQLQGIVIQQQRQPNVDRNDSTSTEILQSL